MSRRSRFRKILPAAFGCCLFFLVAGSKWAVFDRFGSAMPDWDQWDAEAAELLIPWFQDDHFLAHLFTPHNEHRVILTKLQTLALTLANGQWDSRLLAVVNAMLHSAIAVGFWLAARQWLRDSARWQAALFGLVAALFGLPFAWQNILGGFHSQQYWLLGLSLFVLLALPLARPWTARWWFGSVAGLVALFTMGSGLLAPAVVFALVVLRGVHREADWREIRPTLVATAALVAAGLLMRVDVPGHAGIRAQSLHDFVFTIVRSLAWPLRDLDWSSVILWLPWALVLGRVLRKPDRTGDRQRPLLIAALGGWVVLQVLATAFARGLGGEYPASRYMDTLVVGTLANGLALAWLAELPAPRPRRLALAALGGAWLLLVGAGLYRQTAETLRDHLPGAKDYYLKAESHLRGYLATDNPAHFAFPEIPYPSADGLIERLGNPHLRAVMPAVVRAPLPLRAAPDERAAPGECFLQNEQMSPEPEVKPGRGLSRATAPLEFAKTWGSYGPTGPVATGQWRSEALAATLGGWLKFETAGQVGEAGVSLELRDASTDQLLTTVKPTRTPGDSWRAAYVRAPDRPFVVAARDEDPARWMAFSAPVEIGRLSYLAWRVSKNGMLVVQLAAVGIVLLAAVGVRRCRAALHGQAANAVEWS